MKMLSVQVEDAFAQAIDEVVVRSGLYSSRSEFLKDALRKNLEEAHKMVELRKDFQAAARRLGEKAREAGWNGKLLTREDRVKAAEEFLRRK